MVSQDFKINKKVFKRRKSSTIQHKLRVIMKCYTIIGLELDDEEQSFTFKKSHKINGLRMDDPKEYSGRFEIEDLDDEINLKLIVGEKKEEKDAD